MNYEQLFLANICKFEEDANSRFAQGEILEPVSPEFHRFRMLKKGIEQKWIKTTTPIKIGNYIFVPWKIVDDSLYKGPNALWFEENLPRSLVSVHHADTLELERLAYGLNKFGSVDEVSMGSNIQIKELIELGIQLDFSVSQKHNGEAATIWGTHLDGQFYYVIMSKSVPAVVQTRGDLNALESMRFKTCKEIGNQFFDVVEKMCESDIAALQCVLFDYIFPIEKIDHEFKHIACEPPGLYILGVRHSANLNLLIGQKYQSVIDKMVGWGFFESKKFTREEILHRIHTVRSALDTLPNTSDKPSLEVFNSWDTPVNFLRVWSYVSLVYEQVVCPEITCKEILSIGAGIQHDKFNLTEGTIINVFTTEFYGHVYMVKDKDLLYYLLRGIRTVVESYKTKPYRGDSIRSRSLEHWVNYLTPVWRSVWKEFVGVIEKYMSTSICVQAIKSNLAKSATGGIDAPDFFAGVLKWFEDGMTGLDQKTNSCQETISVFKVEYFDKQFQPKSTDLDKYVKLMNMMTKINLSGTKFENVPNAEQIEIANSKWEQTQKILRNPNTGDLIVQNVIEVFQKISKPNPKLAIFITGIPGLGKDWIGNYIQMHLEFRIPELKDLIQVINQDMYVCDPTKYAQGLSKCVQTKSIVIITRNGPGSQKSINICKDAGFAIHLVAPHDAPVLLLGAGIQYSLERTHNDVTKSHVLSSLPDEKIVSIGANFFGSLGPANSFIASSTILNSNSYNSHKYLAIELKESKHLTIEHGLVTNEDLVGTEVQVNSVKIVRVVRPNYFLEFEICVIPLEISDIIDSQVPHITYKTSGYAKPVHSGWWGWIVQKFYLNSIGTVKFGLWELSIKPCDKSQYGTIKLL